MAVNELCSAASCCRSRLDRTDNSRNLGQGNYRRQQEGVVKRGHLLRTDRLPLLRIPLIILL